MDVVYLAEFQGTRQVFRAIQGDSQSFGLRLGEGPDLESAYCPRMVRGAIPNAIPDTANEPGICDLTAVTEGAGVGAYVGVPIELSDGTTYGSFCCLSHDPHDLGDRDVNFMLMLAELVASDVEGQRERDQETVRITDLIAAEELDIALQPIFDVHTYRCLGVEALSRFPSAYGDTGDVFESAYNVGLGLPLERLALTRAISLLPDMPPHQYLSVNLTPRVAYELNDVGATSPDMLTSLVLEITEHAAVESYSELRSSLQTAREQGLRLAIDDAGAGYASLKHVVELAPDIIKIDRSLVDGVSADRARRSVVSAFVLLALDLGATVVAEGVERRADLQAVEDLGVDAAQGYLLARPSTSRLQLTKWQAEGQQPLHGRAEAPRDTLVLPR
jgi:EAL domain-containing protein (putative c-di-GMP-specific phosphodiesterase class I)